MANAWFRVVFLLVSCTKVNTEQCSATMKTAYACAVKDWREGCYNNDTHNSQELF